MDVSRGLALAFVDGDWSRAGLFARGERALGNRPSWLGSLIDHVLSGHPIATDVDLLAETIREHDDFYNAWLWGRARIRAWFFPEPQMIAVEGRPSQFEVPTIRTAGELAARLGLSHSELDWFADRRMRNRRAKDSRLEHYQFAWLAKRSVGHRLLEKPKQRLKAIQRQLLSEVVAAIPPSEHAHGFVSGRSIHTFAAPHVDQRVVIRLDLVDFFSSIRASWVAAIFGRVGYNDEVAWFLASLSTVSTPERILSELPTTTSSLSANAETRGRLRAAHLPQGSPTSPALSNLAAYSLDCRLAGLARSKNVRYTRYADDLVFSGGSSLSRNASGLIHAVGGIALDEGFDVNHRKTRVMRSGARQQVGGLVVNRRQNVERGSYDALRATLFNAARHGPESQNRHGHADFRAHLRGRIAWVAASNTRRGERLLRLFDAIQW